MNKESAIGIGALTVSILSVVLSFYAGYKLQSNFYYGMSVLWTLITGIVIKVYLSLKE